ncbi:MAG TPA: T9SS type A sorting domain-containing protein, partial [Bacteroidetes bacterium]|nr:T9SS type A sorting domain-containing protein [Bacteroidota bacterium]
FIKFNAPREGDYILQLINEKGGMVYQKNYQLNEGKNSILLNAARFPRGIYFIKIKMGGAVVSGKLVLAGE